MVLKVFCYPISISFLNFPQLAIVIKWESETLSKEENKLGTVYKGRLLIPWITEITNQQGEHNGSKALNILDFLSAGCSAVMKLVHLSTEIMSMQAAKRPRRVLYYLWLSCYPFTKRKKKERKKKEIGNRKEKKKKRITSCKGGSNSQSLVLTSWFVSLLTASIKIPTKYWIVTTDGPHFCHRRRSINVFNQVQEKLMESW